MPPAGSVAVPLADLWEPDGQRVADDVIDHCVRAPDEAEKRNRESGVTKVYEDPGLQRVSQHAQFARYLKSRGIIEYTVGQPAHEQVGCFFAKQKGKRLRLILDSRGSNSYFRPPDGVQLFTGEALSLLCGEYESFCVGGADLRNAFYYVALPGGLRDLFALRSVSTAPWGSRR